MRRATDYRSAQQVSIVRRLLTAVLVATYLIVGFGGEISCAQESVSTDSSRDLSVVPAKAEEGSKQAPTVVEHCYTCVPLTIPAAVQISVPVGVTVGLSFPNDSTVVVEKHFLDPPPPKLST